MVRLSFEDGGADEFLFIGLAGPSMTDNVLTPKTPLGAAILGQKVGSTVVYHVGTAQYKVIIQKCLAPGGTPSRKAGGGEHRLAVMSCGDEEDEAAKVAKAVAELLRGGIAAAEIAVSWRGPYQSGPFESALTKNNLRYRLEGVDGFYDLPETAALLAVVRLIANPLDREALFSSLRAFSHLPVDMLESFAAKWEGPEQVLEGKPAKDKGLAALRQLLAAHEPKAASLEEILPSMAQRLRRLRPDIFRDGFRAPWPAFCRAAGGRRLKDFLAEAGEVAARSRRGAREGVILTPMDHLGDRQLKALFLVGAHEGAIPDLHQERGEDLLPAERELFFGVLTAAEKVTISWPRTVYGKSARRTRFLAELSAPWLIEEV